MGEKEGDEENQQVEEAGGNGVEEKEGKNRERERKKGRKRWIRGSGREKGKREKHGGHEKEVKL